MSKIFFAACLFFSYMIPVWAQEASSQEIINQNTQKSLYEQVQNQLIRERVETIEVDGIYSKFEALRDEEREQIENLEVELLREQLQREIRLVHHFKYLESRGKNEILKVAILGNSANNIDNESFNSLRLQKLLRLIRIKAPQAVFFTGNLIYGVREISGDENNIIEFPPKRSIMHQKAEKDFGVFDIGWFEKQLNQFSQVISQTIGNDIPFYPIPGEFENLGPEAVELFKKHFKLDNAQIFDSKQLAYTVSIDNAFFVLFSTSFFDDQNHRVRYGILPQTLNWIQTQLQAEKTNYPFKFALGNLPAFSTKASFNIHEGLDTDQRARDSFWRILRENQVLAYFSSKEILFDRTYWYGLWQVNSGGAGATLDYIDEDDMTFYHFVILSIPSNKENDVILEVFDEEGFRRDWSVLSQKQPPLFQYSFRISARLDVPHTDTEPSAEPESKKPAHK